MSSSSTKTTSSDKSLDPSSSTSSKTVKPDNIGHSQTSKNFGDKRNKG